MITISTIGCTSVDVPVEYEGTLSNGMVFYFRARWNAWTFGVGRDVDAAKRATVQLYPDGFVRSGSWGSEMFSASYMPHEEAQALIARLVEEYGHQEDQRDNTAHVPESDHG